MNLVQTTVTLLSFTGGDYNEDWDEGDKAYDLYTLPVRIKYNMTEREIEQLGENLLLDAILVVRQTDLDELSLIIKNQDHFKIANIEYRITRIQPVMIASQPAGFKIGIRQLIHQLQWI